MNEHIESTPFTADELYSEIGMFMADRLSKNLLRNGLISKEQYQQIAELNKESFPIISVNLLPNSLDITDLQR